jgi:hypothetical protein
VVTLPSGITTMWIGFNLQGCTGDHIPFSYAFDGMTRFVRSGSTGCGIATSVCADAAPLTQTQEINPKASILPMVWITWVLQR